MPNGDTSIGGRQKDFSETRTTWTVIQNARDDSPEVRQRGFEEFCKKYWKPIYQYLRMAWRKSNEDAKDLTQAFFAWLSDPEILKRYAPERGSFRTFLKTLLRHFVQHEDEAMHRLKRGGGQAIVSLDQLGASGYEGPADPQSPDPDEAFEQEWRSTVMAHALDRVKRRLVKRGREIKLRVFEAYCVERPGGVRASYAEIAGQLSLKESDVKQYLIDVREEIRRALGKQIAKMVSTSDEFEEEWKALGA
jgi:RNA polymerase sigma-70 factor (ECF subfamily)